MKAMILAAGFGTRLLPATMYVPKPCFPILNRPIIARIIDNVVKAGVSEIVINLHHLSDRVKEAVEADKPDGVTVHYSFERDILGTAGGIKKVEEILGDGPFILHNGDIFSAVDLKDAVRFHKESASKATMILKEGDHPAFIGLDADRKITRFPYGALSSSTDYSVKTYFTGIHILEPVVFDYIPAEKFYCINSDVYPKLIADGHPAYGYVTDAVWHDIGTPNDYLSVNRELLLGDDFLAGPGTRIGEGCVIGPNTVIGDGCVIGDNCSIQDSVLFDGVTVGDSALIRGSIILDGLSVQDGEKLLSVIITRDEHHYLS
jgi:NDP-sugar pyrophosphorylase family protein